TTKARSAWTGAFVFPGLVVRIERRVMIEVVFATLPVPRDRAPLLAGAGLVDQVAANRLQLSGLASSPDEALAVRKVRGLHRIQQRRPGAGPSAIAMAPVQLDVAFGGNPQFVL